MIRVGALSVVLLLAAAQPVLALNMVSQSAPEVPNIINMYLLPGGPAVFSPNPPTFLLNQPNATFIYNVSADGSFAQLRTTADYSTFTLPFVWDQGIVSNGDPYTLLWQEVQYTYAVGGGGSIDDFSSVFSFTSGPGAAPVTPPSTVQGPVPEPSLLILLGMGAAGLALKTRRGRKVPASAGPTA